MRMVWEKENLREKVAGVLDRRIAVLAKALRVVDAETVTAGVEVAALNSCDATLRLYDTCHEEMSVACENCCAAPMGVLICSQPLTVRAVHCYTK